MKTNFVWATDVHLDCIEDEENTGKNVTAWAKENLGSKEGDAVLLTGDISLGPDLIRHLRSIREASQKKVYFVCGNHDYWDASIVALRKDISAPTLVQEGIVWLGNTDYVPFGESLAVIGHDGWYDALNGDARRSRFVMKDWFRTDEFKVDPRNIVSTSRKLAFEAATHIEASAKKAIADGRKKIILLTHFPPFAEACLYRGQRSNDHALPWYSSRLMGETLILLAEAHPEVTFTVLCGHTHSFTDISPRPNLRVVVGGSDYGSPDSNTIGVTE